MIFSFLKNWKFILDVIIVLVIVAALFIWNPFGIFGGKTKLLDTANMVTEIRQIGELVTAEYYGEVISSLEEARMEYIEDENVQEKATLIFADMVLSMLALREFEEMTVEKREEYVKTFAEMDRRQRRRIIRQDVDRNNIREKMEFLGYLDDLESDRMFLEVLEFWYRQATEKLDKKSFDFDPNTQDHAMVMLFDEKLEKNAKLPGNFMAFYYDTKKKEFTKKELRRKIAMVGRGWVKAGFDFSNLDPSALVYYQEQQEIHIMGIAPTILNADINPWFIPEKGVPGFEILDVNGKVDFEDAKKVKEYCVRKLKDYAHRANILQNAEKQAEETLKNLFSLLLGQEIKRVVFHHDSFVQYVHEIEKDSIMSLGELVLFDSLYRQKIQILDSLRNARVQDTRTKNAFNLAATQLKFAINQMKKISVYDLGEPFNFFSSKMVQIAKDGTIDGPELDSLFRWRIQIPNPLTTDDSFFKKTHWETQFWFDNTEQYAQDYNSSIRGLIGMKLANGPILQRKFYWKVSEPNHVRFDSVRVINIYRYSLDSVLVNYVRDTTHGIERILGEQYYPFQFDRATLDSAVWAKDVVKVPEKNTMQDSIPYFYLLPNPAANSPGYGFPMRFEALILPELAAVLKVQGGTNAEGYRLIFDISKQNKLQATLSPSQEIELYQYLMQIGAKNDEYRNRSVFKKFTGYINGKLAERTNPPDWYSRLRKQL